MKNQNDYLSEFEQEFEMEDTMYADEKENSFEYGGDALEYDASGESEADDEFEWENDGTYQDEFEYGSSGAAYSSDQEYEERLFNAFTSGGDNEFEMEMEIERVLHEMEQDYFFGSLKNFIKKRGPGLLKKLAGSTPLGQVVKRLSRSSRGLIRRALKSKLLRTGIGMIPGYGAAINQGLNTLDGLVNSEMGDNEISREKARQVVQVGKQAYQNLANGMITMNNINSLRGLGTGALRSAVASVGGGGSSFKNKRKSVIPIRPNSIVTVHPDKVVIWQPR